MSELSGVLPVDKPVGLTSHDVVARARRALGTRKIGHTGTLDPFASGLLLLCIGSATRLSELLTGLRKRYSATLKLGEATDTDDLTGEVVSHGEEWRALDEERIRAALQDQTGEIEQLPPRYSAKKVAGERMYAAARRGEEVERTPVAVTVYDLRVTRVAPPEVDFEVECSSGTYIRALARDAGEALGVGAHLTALRRTRVGEYSVDAAVPLGRLDDAEAVRDALLSPAQAVAHLPSVVVDGAGEEAIGHGRAVPAPESLAADGPVAILSAAGQLLALGERRGDTVQPRRVFA